MVFAFRFNIRESARFYFDMYIISIRRAITICFLADFRMLMDDFEFSFMCRNTVDKSQIEFATFRHWHLGNYCCFPFDSFSQRFLSAVAVGRAEKFEMQLGTKNLHECAHVCGEPCFFPSFYFRFALLGFGKIVGAVKISPWHTDFFPFIDDRGHKKSDAQSDSNLKSCLVLFSRFFSFFFAFFRSWKKRFCFLCACWKCVSRKSPCHRTQRRIAQTGPRATFTIKSIILLGWCARPCHELRHRSISIRLWPSLFIISILLCDNFVFCEPIFFCFAFVPLCGLFVVVWLNERSLTYRLSVEKSSKWKSFEFTCAPCAAVCHRLASTSLDTFLWQTFRFIPSKCFNFPSCQCQLNTR